MEWKGFDEVLANCVYALHDYSVRFSSLDLPHSFRKPSVKFPIRKITTNLSSATLQSMGFPTGERYTGTAQQKATLEKQFLRKAEFMLQHNVPIWNGEFGPVYEDPGDENENEEEAAAINSARYALLGAQLEIYARHQCHWSIWLYKDVGVQGMLHVARDSKWMQTIAPFLRKKKQYRLDAWGVHRSEQSEAVVDPLVRWIDEVCPAAKEVYPGPWKTERHVLRNVVQTYLSDAFQGEFAGLFKAFGKAELEECAKSFHFEKCVQRDGLNRILRDFALRNAKEV